MVARTPEKSKQKRLTIPAAAEKLGVTKGHLSRVLRGERVSRRLMRGYRELVKREKIERLPQMQNGKRSAK
jgi:transcriptional regulator with XRE-family HTH domain